MQLFRYYNIFFFFFFFHLYVVFCFHISGVRVKYKLFAYIFFSFLFQIIIQNRGCLGSRDRDQLQPALTTLTN